MTSKTRGAVRFPRRVKSLLQAALELRDRHVTGLVSDHGLAVARGRLANELAGAIFPPKSNAANNTSLLSNHRFFQPSHTRNTETTK